MVDPSLIISIDRTALSLAPLVLSGKSDANALGVSEYQEPALQPRVTYAPPSDYVHGDIALAWSYQQSVLSFTVFPKASTETASRALIAELAAACAQAGTMTFLVTVTVSDADPETWVCDPGTVLPAGSRSLIDLRHANPEWSVSLPCHPVRSV